MLLRFVRQSLLSTFSRTGAHGELDDFDPTFYYRYYGDLRHLAGPAALRRHYLDHGRAEGRFKNLAEARRHFEERFGELPPDFSSTLYKSLNEDLVRCFEHDWQFEFHYLECGRREKRPYKPPGSAAGEENIPWAHLFRLGDFVACASSWLRYRPATRAEGIDIFLREGIDRLAPIALDYMFDPAFYRTAYGFDGEESDAALYRHWLDAGYAQAKLPNEEKALQNLVADRRFPSSFDWVAYKAMLPREEAGSIRHRVDALQHFFDYGFARGLTGPVEGTGGADLYEAVGDYHLIRKHFDLAIAAYERASHIGPSRAALFQHLGDGYVGLGKTLEAHGAFERATQFEAASLWSYLHAAETAAALDWFDKAFDILADARKEWAQSAAWRTAVGTLLDQFFAAKTDLAKSLYAAGERRVADNYMRATLDEIARRITQLHDLPPAMPPRPDGPVVILANQDLPQCKHYRVDQKLRQLQRAGIEARAFAQADVGGFLAALLGARAAIFYRVPAYPEITRAILTARARGIPTYYEIDDLVFDSAYFPDPFASYDGQISREEYDGLLLGVPLYRYAMGLCDHGIASTKPLAREVEKIVRNHDCLVVRNGLDERHSGAIATGQEPRPARNTVTIFYGSGTKAHNADFNDLAGPALLEVMEKHPNVRLVIVGHLRLDPPFDRFEARIRRFDFVADLDDYWALLAASDINLAVLARGAMTDCKSEIKWLEAAVLQVPSVVSSTEAYRDVLEDGVDALLVDGGSEAWTAALLRLVADPALRRRLGASARRKALSLYALDSAAKILRERFGLPSGARALRSAASPVTPAVGDRKKLRLLLCHVFFPPQTFGGATRVVKDNVDFLLDHCPDIGIAVLTTDADGTPPGGLRYDQYRGIPVFRLSTPIEAAMDWRPFNPAHAEVMERLLDEICPDLVHFHCIQRLTASIVACVGERGIPYLVTVHDGWWISDHQFLVDEDDVLRLPSADPFDAAPPRGISPVASVARRQGLARLLDGAVEVIAVSESFAEIYRRAGCRNVITIENGVSSIAPVGQRTSPSGRLMLGHLGGRSAHKGARLVEAVLRTTPFDRLALVMTDAAFEPGATSERVWGTTPVLLRGPCPQSEVSKLYASLDVLLAPSIWPESFGLVAREARAQGLWVVASDRGAMSEGIEDGVNGFVIDVADGRDLAAVLRKLDADVPRYKQPPPKDGRVLRRAADQGRDIADLYRRIVAGCRPQGDRDSAHRLAILPRAALPFE